MFPLPPLQLYIDVCPGVQARVCFALQLFKCTSLKWLNGALSIKRMSNICGRIKRWRKFCLEIAETQSWLCVWYLPYGAAPASSCTITRDVEHIQTCYVERSAWGSGVAAPASHVLKLSEWNDKSFYNGPPIPNTINCCCRHVRKISDWPDLLNCEAFQTFVGRKAAWWMHFPSVLTCVVWLMCTAFKVERFTWRPPLF